jgi:hypothetical protein
MPKAKGDHLGRRIIFGRRSLIVWRPFFDPSELNPVFQETEIICPYTITQVRSNHTYTEYVGKVEMSPWRESTRKSEVATEVAFDEDEESVVKG